MKQVNGRANIYSMSVYMRVENMKKIILIAMKSKSFESFS